MPPLFRHLSKLNRSLAVKLTSAVGTMGCAYVFALLALIGFPGFHAAATAYVQWVSQTFIQLVMLSVIMVGQRIMSDAHEAQHRENKRLHQQHSAALAAMQASHDALHAKVDALAAPDSPDPPDPPDPPPDAPATTMATPHSPQTSQPPASIPSLPPHLMLVPRPQRDERGRFIHVTAPPTDSPDNPDPTDPKAAALAIQRGLDQRRDRTPPSAPAAEVAA